MAGIRSIEYVYVIGSSEDHRVKIGRSVEPVRRLARLQTSAPFPLRVLWQRQGDVDLETALHREFASRRTHGEWFDFGEQNAVAVIAAAMMRLDPTLTRVRAKRKQAAKDRVAKRIDKLIRIINV